MSGPLNFKQLKKIFNKIRRNQSNILKMFEIVRKYLSAQKQEEKRITKQLYENIHICIL